MSASRIRLVVDFEILEGKFAEFESIVKQMVEVSRREPGTIAYHFLLSADHRRCRLFEGYVDQAAIAAHFDGPAVQQFVPRLDALTNTTRMEIYGDPGPHVTAIATGFGAEIFTAWEGFDD